jgi:hypothetical protein
MMFCLPLGPRLGQTGLDAVLHSGEDGRDETRCSKGLVDSGGWGRLALGMS